MNITEEERMLQISENANTIAIGECLQKGKVWVQGIFTNPGSGTCLEKLNDAGKPYKDSDECLGNCISASRPSYTIGKKEQGACSEADNLNCWTIEDEVVSYTSICSSI